jgi:hypothetical protein
MFRTRKHESEANIVQTDFRVAFVLSFSVSTFCVSLFRFVSNFDEGKVTMSEQIVEDLQSRIRQLESQLARVHHLALHLALMIPGSLVVGAANLEQAARAKMQPKSASDQALSDAVTHFHL